MKSIIPEIRFHKPHNPRHSELVFSQRMEPAAVLQLLPSSESEKDTENETTDRGDNTDVGDTPVKRPPELDKIPLQVLYHTAMILNSEMKTHVALPIQWPPVPENFDLTSAEKTVLVPLYNLVAWITGLSEEVTEEKFVRISPSNHNKILSGRQEGTH